MNRFYELIRNYFLSKPKYPNGMVYYNCDCGKKIVAYNNKLGGCSLDVLSGDVYQNHKEMMEYKNSVDKYEKGIDK